MYKIQRVAQIGLFPSLFLITNKGIRSNFIIKNTITAKGSLQKLFSCPK